MTTETKHRITQIQSGKIPDGYKKFTDSNYVVPNEWSEDNFSNIFAILRNNTFTRAEMNDENGVVRNIHYGDVLIKYEENIDCNIEEIPFINTDVELKKNSDYLMNGDVVIADTAEDNTVGKAAEICNIGKKRILAGLHTIPCRPRKKRFASKYLGYYINSPLYHTQLIPLITGIKVSSISRSAILDTKILLPPMPEQQKIARILSAQDKVISLRQKLLQEKQRQKKYLMRKLLSQDGASFTLCGTTIDKRGWKKKRFSDVFDFLRNNTFSRAEMNIEFGEIHNIHYGDILVKFNCIVDGSNENIPFLTEDAQNYKNIGNYSAPLATIYSVYLSNKPYILWLPLFFSKIQTFYSLYQDSFFIRERYI